MADESLASPRPTKRRRTGNYSADRTILKSPEKQSTLINVSNALSSISKRLFNRNKTDPSTDLHDDSAYGSKEDSFNGDDNTALESEIDSTEQDAEKENTRVSGARKAGRKRQSRSSGPKTISAQEATNTDGHLMRSKKATRSSRSTIEDVDNNEPSRVPESLLDEDAQLEGGIDHKISESKSDKSSTHNNPVVQRRVRGRSNGKLSVIELQETQDTAIDSAEMHEDISSAVDTVDDSSNTDIQPRSSGRERKRPRRYSNEIVPKDKTKLVQKKSKLIENVVSATLPSPEKASSPQPKGILTPSRRKRDGPRKSVVFDESEKQIEDHFGFKDIEASTKKSHKVAPGTVNTKSLSTPVAFEAVIIPQSEASTPVVQQIPQIGPEPDEADFLLERDYPEDILQGLELLSTTNLTKFAGSDVEDDPHLIALKTIILSRITSSTTSPIAHLPSQFDTLHNLLSATITAGESNSLLLLGSRGAGKSLLVNKALSDLTSKHGNDFHIIRLNGFFQTDDKLALREIWRQLGREMQVSEDETGEISSYADTMASLLSILSHPEEMMDVPMGATDEAGTTAKSVIFILDEFDLFTTHPRQTLLYNLFDIAQSRKAPIAVIGCSTRMDVVECLEKRVKSRFSHRWLHVPTMKNLPNFIEAVQGVLCLATDGSEALHLSKTDLQWREQWNEHIKATFLPCPEIQDLIKRTFHSTKSLPDLLMSLYIPIATVNLELQRDAPSSSAPILFSTSTVPSLLSLLPDLPLLHLSLLIAASRLDTIYNLAALNFNLVYSHYVDLVSKTKLQRSASGMLPVAAGAGLRIWTKETARMAWEELGNWEVIVPVSGLSNGRGGTAKAEEGEAGGEGGGARMWRVDVTLEEVAWAIKEKLGVVGIGEILGRWCREIVF